MIYNLQSGVHWTDNQLHACFSTLHLIFTYTIILKMYVKLITMAQLTMSCSCAQMFMLRRTSEEPTGHAAAIMSEVLMNAECNGVIDAAQKRLLLHEIALRLSSWQSSPSPPSLTRRTNADTESTPFCVEKFPLHRWERHTVGCYTEEIEDFLFSWFDLYIHRLPFHTRWSASLFTGLWAHQGEWIPVYEEFCSA